MASGVNRIIIADTTGCGGMGKSGAGSLRLAGNNTFTGGVIFNDGLLTGASGLDRRGAEWE